MKFDFELTLDVVVRILNDVFEHNSCIVWCSNRSVVVLSEVVHYLKDCQEIKKIHVPFGSTISYL
jgi:hypothetical protein